MTTPDACAHQWVQYIEWRCEKCRARMNGSYEDPMTPTTPADLAELERLYDQATPAGVELVEIDPSDPLWGAFEFWTKAAPDRHLGNAVGRSPIRVFGKDAATLFTSAVNALPGLLAAARQVPALEARIVELVRANDEIARDIDRLDAVVHALGIEDSEDDPAEAVKALEAEVEKLRAITRVQSDAVATLKEKLAMYEWALPAPAQAEPVAWQWRRGGGDGGGHEPRDLGARIRILRPRGGSDVDHRRPHPPRRWSLRMTDLELREAALKAAGDAVGQSRPYEDDIVVAVDAILAAIRASGRLAPEVAETAEYAARDAAYRALQDQQWAPIPLGAMATIVDAAAPIIAAAAEAKAREECAMIAQGNSAEFDFQGALAECRDSEYGFHNGRLHAAKAIRTGAAS